MQSETPAEQLPESGQAHLIDLATEHPECCQTPNFRKLDKLLQERQKYKETTLKHGKKIGGERHPRATPSVSQASFNRRIEELFAINQHDKAWQVFIEMEESAVKPNMTTFSLLFKNVRRSCRNPFETSESEGSRCDETAFAD